MVLLNGKNSLKNFIQSKPFFYQINLIIAK